MSTEDDYNPERTPQDDLMEAVCNDAAAAAIAGIDAALAAGANFTNEDVQPLFFAAFGGHAEVVAHLIKRGATLAGEWPASNRFSADRRDEVHGRTALHAAAERGDTEILRLLLDADGKRFMNTFAELGHTPLAVAAREGHLEAVKPLLAAGADVNAHDECHIGETALSEAVQAGHGDVASLLLDAGADPTIRGWMGLTAIHRAQMGGEPLAPILELIRQRLALPKDRWQQLLLPDRR